MATIKDVAIKSGVSISTISRTLSGNVPVNEETREKVLKAVKELNYQPNYFAKGLKNGKTNTIALIVPNISNPIFPVFTQGVESVAHENRYNVILCNTDENLEIEKEYIRSLKNRSVDGFIFATAKDGSDHIAELHSKGVPVIALSRNISDAVDAVVIDNYNAAHMIVKYLIEMGHRRIAVLTGSLDIPAFQLRLDGYCAALAEAGIPYDEKLVYDTKDSLEVEDTYRCVLDNFCENGVPEAVFCMSDPKVLGLYRAVNELGYRIPQDISVASIDNLYFSAFLNPPLTTVAQPFYEMGRRAAERLIQTIGGDGREEGEPAIEIMSTELIIRESVTKRERV